MVRSAPSTHAVILWGMVCPPRPCTRPELQRSDLRRSTQNACPRWDTHTHTYDVAEAQLSAQVRTRLLGTHSCWSDTVAEPLCGRPRGSVLACVEGGGCCVLGVQRTRGLGARSKEQGARVGF